MVDQVREHLRPLPIVHDVVGGIGYLVSLFTILTLIRPEARQLFGLPPLGNDGTVAPRA